MLAFTTDALNAVFRNEVDDATSTPLWSDPEVYLYMTEAVDALNTAVEGQYKILSFSITPATVVSPVVPVPITLPRNLLHIREAKLTGVGRFIKQSRANAHIANAYVNPPDSYGTSFTGSAHLTYGTPSEYVRDYYNRALYLLPVPNITDTLELQCTVTLGVPLTSGMPLTNTDTKDQRLVLHYMKYLAYAKHDADTLDLQRSMQFKGMFDEGAKEREVRLRSYRRSPGTVQMEW